MQPKSTNCATMKITPRNFIKIIIVVLVLIILNSSIHLQLLDIPDLVVVQTKTYADNSTDIPVVDDRDEVQLKKTAFTSSFCKNETNLISNNCLNYHAQQIARAFPLVPRSRWCVPSTEAGQVIKNERGEWQGLLLVKVHKAASSTTAGLVYHLYNRTGGCAIQGMHYNTLGIDSPFKPTDPNHSFLFAPIRRPSSRDLSHIKYFKLAFHWKRKKNPNWMDYKNKLHENDLTLSKGFGGYQFNYISHWRNDTDRLVSKDRVIHPAKIHNRLYDLFQRYGFFFIAERMEESIVALACVMGLPIRDIVLPSSAKIRGNESYFYKRKNQKCYRLPNFDTPRKFVEYLESSEYKRETYADQLLYVAANYSLDLTIKHTIGVARFEEALAEYRLLTKRILDYCGERIRGVCHINQTVTLPEITCYFRDFGCGYQCVNVFFAKKNN